MKTTLSGKTCSFAIQLIEKDGADNFKSRQKKLKDLQEYNGFSLAPTLVRQCAALTLTQASTYLFHNYRLANYGLNFLFRVYFSQVEKTAIPETVLPIGETSPWLDRLETFARFYTEYYLEKYNNDWRKFSKHVLTPFPTKAGEFQHWLDNTFQSMRVFYEGMEPPRPLINLKIDEYEENLCYDEIGNYNPLFARFAVQFCLNQQYFFQPSQNQ
ncbi:MAG: hypothetical protein IPN20_22700 [Haliscomenobacter sp.]|nr:hypothetical protein [Haliscomenobacter sp.]